MLLGLFLVDKVISLFVKDMSKLNLVINNVLDDPEIPGVVVPDIERCLELITEYTGSDRKLIFPSDGHPACRSIAVDYGRSHYFFTNGSLLSAEIVHQYCYMNFGEVEEDERGRFFRERIGLLCDPKLADDVTPTRGLIITKVKYEVLCEFWHECGFGDESRSLAFMGMYYSTQHPLRYIKHRIINAIQEAYGNVEMEFKFPFVRIDFFVRDEEPMLGVTYLNFFPKKGNWQVLGRLPVGNRYKLEAIFTINLHNLESGGEVSISTKGSYSKKEIDMKDCYGIYNASKKTVIRYRDTSPTW